MRDFIEIGPAPFEEDCAQVGDPDYQRQATAECRAFIEAIRRKLGPEPEGAYLKVKWFDHDFGSYCQVVCFFEDDNPQAVDYAYKCEAEAPATWEEVGMTPPR